MPGVEGGVEAGAERRALHDVRDGAIREAHADAAVPRDGAEDRAPADHRVLEPTAKRAHGASRAIAPERHAHERAGAFLVGLALLDKELESIRREARVLDVERDELARSQRRRKPERQQRAIASADPTIGLEDGAQLPELVDDERSDAARRVPFQTSRRSGALRDDS